MQQRGVADPEGAARKAFGMMMRREATVLGFGDGFFFLAAACAAAGLLGLFANPPRPEPLPVVSRR
jgi:MFS transporter, DHA2 family, multidrug resistance protein